MFCFCYIFYLYFYLKFIFAIIVKIKNMSTQIDSEFMTRLQSPLLPVSLVKTELLRVIKNEPPEREIAEIGIDDSFHSSNEESIPEIKAIDIVSHILCEDSIKSETEHETKHSESVETPVFVKIENPPFVKIENITENEKLIKTEHTGDKNVNKVTDQGTVKVEDFYASDNLETNELLVPNFSKDLNGISIKSRKPKCPKKIDLAKCQKTHEITSWKEDKAKIKIIKAPVIPVEPHEYTSLAKDKHVCNHCQYTFNKLKNLKVHITKLHREDTIMYQCPYCVFKSKYMSNLPEHIIQKHKDTKDIQRFQYCCDKCNYKTCTQRSLKKHKLIHLKPEETQYFYCYHCHYKCKRKDTVKSHIFRHFKNEEVAFYCYICDFMTPKRDLIVEHIKRHSKVQIKSEIKEEID